MRQGRPGRRAAWHDVVADILDAKAGATALAEWALRQSRQDAPGVFPDRTGRPDEAPDQLIVRP